jgi:hypothetical protein
MSAFYTLLTDAGQVKLAAALALGEPLAFHEMALGDGNGNPVTPLASMTALVHEVYRAELNSVTLDQTNPNFIICELIVPAVSGGWNIRECGIFDDENTLIAIGNFPETYKPLPAEGSVRDLIIRNILAVENTAAVNLVINANIAVATQAWVVTQLTDLAVFNDSRYEPLGTVAAHNTAATPHPDKFEAAGAVDTHNQDLDAHGASKIGDIALFPSYVTAYRRLPCNGATVSRSIYSNLFNRIGTGFGAGDGTTTFNVPNIPSIEVSANAVSFSRNITTYYGAYLANDQGRIVRLNAAAATGGLEIYGRCANDGSNAYTFVFVAALLGMPLAYLNGKRLVATFETIAQTYRYNGTRTIRFCNVNSATAGGGSVAVSAVYSNYNTVLHSGGWQFDAVLSTPSGISDNGTIGIAFVDSGNCGNSTYYVASDRLTSLKLLDSNDSVVAEFMNTAAIPTAINQDVSAGSFGDWGTNGHYVRVPTTNVNNLVIPSSDTATVSLDYRIRY